MKDVLRTERKFLLNLAEATALRGKLDAMLHRDAHAGLDGYSVRSLYFDTADDQDFYEKEAGIEVRRKIRLRIYSPDDRFAFLEMKQKKGTFQHKRSLKMTREDARQLIAGDYDVLLGYQEPFAAECGAKMMAQFYHPVTIVEYKRVPYVGKENQIRITLDSRIEATESCFDLFSDKLNMNPVMDPSQTVLEVKYNGFLLSYYRDILNQVDRSEISVSKYVLARQHSFRSSL